MFNLLSRKHNMQSLSTSTLFDNDTFYKAFNTDLYCARQRVYIESPFITTRRVQGLLPILTKLRQRGVQVVINTRCPDEHEGEYVAQASDAISAMQELGVRVLYTVKHHRKLAVIDDVLWEGSLNILSQNDSCEIMRRIVSSALSDEMLRFTRANKYVG